jgi:hypothetical protein
MFDLGATLLPAVSRVCARWRSIAVGAPASLVNGLIDKTVALCAESRASPPELLCGWAARTRALMARVGPHLLHSGHLVDAVVGGDGEAVRWIRSQQHPWSECDPQGCDDRRHLQWGENNPACYDFCPRCGRGREADAWPWACAAYKGIPDTITLDMRALVAARGPITERQRDCWMLVLDGVLVDLARCAETPTIGVLVDEQLVRTRQRQSGDFTIWAAAAATGRLDLLEWGHSTARDLENYPRMGSVVSATSDVERYAASSGHIDVIQWVMDTHRQGDQFSATRDHHLYWAALEGGRTDVLDWLSAKCDALLRAWDRQTSGNFFDESPWRALVAPDASSLRWLRGRGVTIPATLLECIRGDDEYVLDRLELAGSPKTVAYAVDVCGCHRPNAKALRLASRQNRVDLVRQAAERGWIDTKQQWAGLLTRAVDNRADAVVEWIVSFHLGSTLTPAGPGDDRAAVAASSDAASLTTSQWNLRAALEPPRPFSTKYHFADSGLSMAMVLRHAAGAPWANAETLVSRGACASAASILWALSKGCPMSRCWGETTKRGVMIACASALFIGGKSAPRRHASCLDLDAVEPLACMTRSDAVVARAWIDIHRLIQRHAKAPCDAAGAITRDAQRLCEGQLPDDSMEQFVSVFWARPDRGLWDDEHYTRMLSKRQRTRLRRKRSRALGYFFMADITF